MQHIPKHLMDLFHQVPLRILHRGRYGCHSVAFKHLFKLSSMELITIIIIASLRVRIATKPVLVQFHCHSFSRLIRDFCDLKPTCCWISHSHCQLAYFFISRHGDSVGPNQTQCIMYAMVSLLYLVQVCVHTSFDWIY